ncbi:MAG TPA: N-6 DNA methylase [Terriglobia bacterium]|nr:N-6 DNA methylase [Terriglobia bacterium]
MPTKFHQILRAIGRDCESKSLTEAEVEKIFQQRDFFTELGYEGFGKDILAQRGKLRKRYDVALTGFGGRVHAVIEFKKARSEPLRSFAAELNEKYVKPHLALFGVLTNGVDLVFYARANGEFTEQFAFTLAKATEDEAQKTENWLRKRKVQFELLESVLERLRFNLAQQLLISDTQSEPARIFFQMFQLRRESAFGRLVIALKELLPKTMDVSRFAKGSYEFWLKTYARQLKYKDVPESWKDFLGSKASIEIAQFSFSLETAYTIVSRLMLAKAADDQGFPGVRFVPRIRESLNELSVHDRLRPEHYREIVERSFRRASETVFSSIFLQDIFDWWFECQPAEGRALFYALGECLLAVTQFNFLELSGDLLGELYQLYFDRDTRKALGEFYTPAEVIEFILNECGYDGQQGQRLLDPACGSGSFLAAALKRYLRQAGRRHAKDVLLDLTEGLRIVGFDINPFAVLMAQINYAALILPRYAEAIQQDRDFRILRLPVFRTDSLRIEEREEDGSGTSKGGIQISMRFAEGLLNLTVYLPIQEEKKTFHKMLVGVPRYLDARQRGLISNLEEYVAALARVFQTVRDPRFTLQQLLQSRFGERSEKLETYLQPMLTALEKTVAELKGKYEDGRFMKAIEDLVLAVSLKHDLQYEFVVANPPYVRIQKIPEHVKEYWAEKYEWTEHNYDLYITFLERAVRAPYRDGWLADGGRLGFILSDRFLNVDYGGKLREHLPRALRVDLLIDFRDTRVFAGALNYPAILIAERQRDGREDELQAARVFASEADPNEIYAEFQALRKNLGTRGVERGKSVEVFTFPRNRLKGPGWWFMPEPERRLIDRLHEAPGKSLIELTATSSGGFAGYQTSADSILVFDEIEDKGHLLRVQPRHEGEKCGCEKKPIEIEKGALKPFIFGKDVARWAINWKRTWVMFPYDRYEKKQTLQGETVKDWNLIPCKTNLDQFDLLNPDSVQVFEERFPKAWKYLRKHEAQLRAREDSRFAEGRAESHLWYGATYPRGLDYYFRPKLVLQLLSRRNSFALNQEGEYVFQAGGKGGGVYGIAPGKAIANIWALLAFLNANVADFIVKEISSVYGGRFYSYADQFLRQLPVAVEIMDGKATVTRKLATLARNLTAASERRVCLMEKTRLFPGSFDGDLGRYELDTVRRLAEGHPTSAQITIDRNAATVEKTLYGFEVRYGSQHTFQFERREHANCLAEALRSAPRQSLSVKEILEWRLPVTPEGAKKLLNLLAQTRKELVSTEDKIRSQEEELNHQVYDLYGLSEDEQKIIEEFLARYSSTPAVSHAQTLDEDEDENDSAGAAP